MVSDDAPPPSPGILAGQLGYLFEDNPELRNASDEDLAERLSHDDRWARARARYPMHSDDEVRAHVDELEPRITAGLVHEARAILKQRED